MSEHHVGEREIAARIGKGLALAGDRKRLAWCATDKDVDAAKGFERNLREIAVVWRRVAAQRLARHV